MLDALKTFLAGLAGDAGTARGFADYDHRLAAVALLVHVADVNGDAKPAEATRIREIVAERYGLDPWEAARLINAAQASDREAVDLYRFTSVLTRALPHADRLAVIEMMWRIVYADGEIDELEDNLVWRVAELLGVSTGERVALRRRIAAQTGGKPEPP
jgi:uncharacterized tellurite resistance protein B-like protein